MKQTIKGIPIKQYYKEYSQRPEVKQRKKEYNQRPEVKQRQKEYSHEKYMTDEKFRAKVKESFRKAREKYESERASRLFEKANKYFDDPKMAELFVMDGIPLEKEMKKRGIL